MIRILLKKQLAETMKGFFLDAKTGKARSKTSTVLYILLLGLLLIGVLGMTFGMFCFALCEPMFEAGTGWLYFALTAMVAFIFGLVGNVFSTYAALYRAKDNDLLLSLPIPTYAILIARLTGVYLIGALFTAIVMFPAIIVYAIVILPGFGGILGAFLLYLAVTGLVLASSCLFGWMIAKVSKYVRHKNIVSLVLALVFIGLYYTVYFRAMNALDDLLEKLDTVRESLSSVYPLLILGRAGLGEPLPLVLVLAVTGAVLALLYTLLSRNFIAMATATEKTQKVVYRESVMKIRTPARALFGKECMRFVGSTTYLLNAGIGAALTPILGILFLLKGAGLWETLSLQSPALLPYLPAFAVGLMVFLVSMTTVTASSVSLEGKSLWLSQSLPIASRSVLFAKMELQIAVTAPGAAVASVCVSLALRLTVLETVFALLAILSYVWLAAALGLFFNLRHPNLHWTNETAVVKQSLAVTLSLFGGWLYGLLCMGSGFLLTSVLGAIPCLLIETAIALGLSLLLTRWISGRGCAIFDAL